MFYCRVTLPDCLFRLSPMPLRDTTLAMADTLLRDICLRVTRLRFIFLSVYADY